MTTPLQLSATQFDNIKDAVIVTGSARSGTSILGQLVSTLRGLEYGYEPQIVSVVLRLLQQNHLSREVALLLLRLHLHEDLLLESAHGRRANLRPDDMTLVLNSIAWPELVRRWSSISNTADAVNYIQRNKLRLAIKNVGVMDSIDVLVEAMPQAKFVVIMRDGRDVVSSLLKKGWLTDAALESSYWPYKTVDGFRIPDRVEDGMAEKWTRMTPAARGCYLWRRDAEHALAEQRVGAGRSLIIRYEELLANASEVLGAIANFVGAEMTEMSHARTRMVRPQRESADYEFLALVEADERHKFDDMNRAWGYPPSAG
jgi:hypothetical protein